MSDGDGVNPVELTSRDGTVRISGSGSVDLSAAGGGISPQGVGGSFQRNPALVSTNSLAPVAFWSVPFTLLGSAGDVLFDMTSIAFMVNNAPAATAFSTNMGTVYTCDIDGVGLPDAAVVQMQLTDDGAVNPSSIATWTTSLELVALATALAPGAHTFNVFFFVLDANCTTQTAAGEAKIEIRRL
jgi:hypothetical protein